MIEDQVYIQDSYIKSLKTMCSSQKDTFIYIIQPEAKWYIFKLRIFSFQMQLPVWWWLYFDHPRSLMPDCNGVYNHHVPSSFLQIHINKPKLDFKEILVWVLLDVLHSQKRVSWNRILVSVCFHCGTLTENEGGFLEVDVDFEEIHLSTIGSEPMAVFQVSSGSQ